MVYKSIMYHFFCASFVSLNCMKSWRVFVSLDATKAWRSLIFHHYKSLSMRLSCDNKANESLIFANPLHITFGVYHLS